MKYINEYLEKVLKIKPLGKITLLDSDSVYGKRILIDGKDIGVNLTWKDYATFLENKLSNGLYITTPSPCNM